MKLYLIGLILITSCSTKKIESYKTHETPSNLELVELKPIKPQGSKILSTLNAELINEDGILIQKQSTSLGDCKKCSRGFGVKGFIGVRFEGMNLKALNIGRKQSPKVNMVDCAQNQLINNIYNCKFKIENRLYHLRISVN